MSDASCFAFHPSAVAQTSKHKTKQSRTFGIPCSQGAPRAQQIHAVPMVSRAPRGRREHQNLEARNLKPKTRNPTPEKVRKKQLPKTVGVSLSFCDIMIIFYPNQINQILGTFFPCSTRVVFAFHATAVEPTSKHKTNQSCTYGIQCS